ncbi:MAG: hypothetical protein KC766_02050 [Myxococcales bacterium]|nr:hypothetical protein [Myxococcales bacterium]
MLPFQDRYCRQRKLPEVGKLGQERIEARRAVVRGGPEALIELAYLERAGVARLELRSGPPRAWPHGAQFSHEGPSRVALGAWGALRQIQQALISDTSDARAEPPSPDPRDPS